MSRRRVSLCCASRTDPGARKARGIGPADASSSRKSARLFLATGLQSRPETGCAAAQRVGARALLTLSVMTSRAVLPHAPVPDPALGTSQPSHDQPELGSRTGARRVAVNVAVVAVILGAAVFWAIGRNAEGVAIRQLPTAERQALYERTLSTLKTTCNPTTRPSGLERFCSRQAELIVQFPECDQACVLLAHPAEPTR